MSKVIHRTTRPNLATFAAGDGVFLIDKLLAPPFIINNDHITQIVERLTHSIQSVIESKIISQAKRDNLRANKMSKTRGGVL